MTASPDLLDTDTLTGVVAHDTSHDPFPVTGWERGRLGGGERNAVGGLLPTGLRDAA